MVMEIFFDVILYGDIGAFGCAQRVGSPKNSCKYNQSMCCLVDVETCNEYMSCGFFAS